MSAQRFSATIESSANQSWIALPFDPNQVWGAKARHHVTGSVNNHPWRGPLAQEGTHYRLVLGAAWRRDAGLEAGAAVTVELAPEGPQIDSLAPDLAAALNAEPQARAFFETLATFYRKNYLRWLDGAKKPEARAERIAALVALLKSGRKQRD